MPRANFGGNELVGGFRQCDPRLFVFGKVVLVKTNGAEVKQRIAGLELVAANEEHPINVIDHDIDPTFWKLIEK